MIKDLDILYDIAPLFENKLIVWLVADDESSLLKDMIEMGAGKRGIVVCDLDPHRWGKKIGDLEIKSPYMLREYLKDVDLKNTAACILSRNNAAQEEILQEIKYIGLGEAGIYTNFGIRCGIYYGLKSSYMNEAFRQKKIMQNNMKINQIQMTKYSHMGYLKYFAFAPLHNDEIIMVYQCGKVGSSSVYASIRHYRRNVMHFHYLEAVVNESIGDIGKVIESKSGKIISLVREPIARAISDMWHSIEYLGAHGNTPDMRELENSYFKEGFENFQAEWFDKEFKKHLGINVLDYPFNKEKGYQVIKSQNIELLILKMECLNDLASVIGEFLGIEDFHFYNTNIAEDKSYRFAYKEYKNRFSITDRRIENIFRENQFVRHFYTEAECEKFMQMYKSK